MDYILAVDYYDLIGVSEELFDAVKIDSFLALCAEKGITALQWRVSLCGLLAYDSATPDNFLRRREKCPAVCDISPTHWKINRKLETIMRRSDPLEAACRSARRHGLKIVPWLTIYDDYGPDGRAASSFVMEHPDKSWRSHDGRDYFHGVLSYVYPETVAFRMRQIEELLAYDADGIYLCTRSHSRPLPCREALAAFAAENPNASMTDFERILPPGFHKKQNELARGLYGFDPPAVAQYRLETGKEPVPEDTEWWKFRGAYLTRFLQEVKRKAAAKNRTLSFGLRDSPLRYAGIYPDHFFDWRYMAESGLVNEMHYHFPEEKFAVKEIFPELHSGGGGQGIGRLFLGIQNKKLFEWTCRTLKSLSDSKIINGIQFFEAFHFFRNPAYWNLIGYFNSNKGLDKIFEEKSDFTFSG